MERLARLRLHGLRRADADVASPEYFVAGARSAAARLCNQPAMMGVAAADRRHRPRGAVGIADEPAADMPDDDARWSVPPSLALMLQPLASLQRPTGSLYRLYTDARPMPDATPTSYRYGPNRIDIGGTPIDVGFSIDLTIEPAVQALAQRTAACYTGRQDICRALGLARSEDAARSSDIACWSSAVVRMAAIAVIDIATGRIEALAGALSPCTRQEYDGPGRAKSCDKRLPYPIRYRPDALLNPAVYHDAMPASVIKPIMAAAFLSDRDVGARWLAAEQAATAASRIAVARQPPRPADALEFGALPRPDVLRRPGLPALPAAVGRAGDGTRLRLERRLRRRARRIAASATSCSVARSTRATHRAPWRRWPRSFRMAGSSPSRSATSSARRFGCGAPTPLDPAMVRGCAAGADGRRPSSDDWEQCRAAAWWTSRPKAGDRDMPAPARWASRA